MNLTDNKAGELFSVEQVLHRCYLAADLIHSGQYEEARKTLGGLWQGIGKRPDIEVFPQEVQAEILLQCGSLSGWLGWAQQIFDAQEKAKDLLTESLRLFESSQLKTKMSEVQYELGICYWRMGAYDESRVVLKEALTLLGNEDTELQAKIHIRRTLVEIWLNRYYEAWNILREAEPIFQSGNDALKGRWHGQMGLVLIRLSNVERNKDYADRAIIEFTAAIYHYEQAGHERYCALNLNNLAMLFHMLGRYQEAHQPLDRAERIFKRLNDSGNLAQVHDTKARVLLAEQKYREANRVISNAIDTFERGGEQVLLADALAVQGVIWARLGLFDSSLRALNRAIEIAESSGSPSNAGVAALTLIEEHFSRLPDTQLYKTYLYADRALKDTQDAGDIARLRSSAQIVIKRLAGTDLIEGFSLPDAVQKFEARYIEQALEIEMGSVSRAAKRLGIKHQSLASLLKRRHKLLQSKRTPSQSRRRSIFKTKREN